MLAAGMMLGPREFRVREDVGHDVQVVLVAADETVLDGQRNAFLQIVETSLVMRLRGALACASTRPPPRYNEGTLIEAMQNAWRFVDDEVLRDRLKGRRVLAALRPEPRSLAG
jgi:hypothetical protein